MRNVVLALALAGCHAQTSVPIPAPSTSFGNPQQVTITGWHDFAMEPFVSHDGSVLFFNNSNAASANTDLHWATRVDDLTYAYQGPLGGVNTPALEAVASLANDGMFYFVSTRSYSTTASTLYRGRYASGVVSGVELVPGVSTSTPGIVNFDAEVSGDDQTLYFVESQFSMTGQPQTADILVATNSGTTFSRTDSASMKNVNTDALEYAPAISRSGLELFFTRQQGSTPPIILRATRASTSDAFGPPEQLVALTGFVEAPALSSDEKAIYYHRNDDDGLVGIWRATRN